MVDAKEFASALYASEEEAAELLRKHEALGGFRGRPYAVRDGRRVDVSGTRRLGVKAAVLGEATRAAVLAAPGDPTVEQSRDNANRSRIAMLLPPPAGFTHTDRLVASVPCRVYRPDAATGAAALPMVAFFHGGGWVQCSLDSHHALCAELCVGAQVVVVSAAYRLAPEHRYPAAIDDCFAVYSALRAPDTAAELGGDPARVAVAGDSAGGNLSCVVSMRCVESGGALPPPACQLLMYPSVHLEARNSSRLEFVEPEVLLSRERLRWFRRMYIAAEEDAYAARCEEPEASPLLYAGDWSRLPPSFVLTAGFDPLRDEAQFYASRLEAAGVAVERLEVPGTVHAFLILPRVLPEAVPVFAALAAYLRQQLK
jgi:acetyl esterase